MTPLFPPATVPHPHQHAADAPSPGGDTWEDKEEGGNVKEYFPLMRLSATIGTIENSPDLRIKNGKS